MHRNVPGDGIGRVDRVIHHLDQRRRHLLRVDQHRRHVGHRDLERPIGRIGLRLGLAQRPRHQLGKVRFPGLRRLGLGEVHQLRDDRTEPVALLVDQMRRGRVLGVR